MSALEPSRAATIEDLIAIEAQTCGRFELINGKLVEKDSPGEPEASVICSRTALAFGYHFYAAVELKGYGAVFGGAMTYRLGNDFIRADVSVILHPRVPPAEAAYFAGAPDIVIDVVTPMLTFGEIHRRVTRWRDHGARLYILAAHNFPETTIYRPGTRPIILGPTSNLSGEDVLPGFEVPVKAFFPYLTEPT